MRDKKTHVCMTLDGDLLGKLRIVAEEDERSLSQYVNRILRSHISNISDSKKDQNDKT